MTRLDISRQLYEATGWDDAREYHMLSPTELTFSLPDKDGKQSASGASHKWNIGQLPHVESPWYPREFYPAYDSDYLLGKLPVGTTLRKNKTNPRSRKGNWRGAFSATVYSHEPSLLQTADTPSDALALLAIRLKEEGIL